MVYFLICISEEFLGLERCSMQLLTFTLGQQQYGIDTRSIVEVLPFISANPVPQQGEEIRGLVRYRGNLVPVIDLCQLIADRPCQLRLGTRTVVVRTAPIESNQESSLFAITAEDVVGMSTTVADVETPEHSESFIGPIVDIENTTNEKKALQIILVNQLGNNENLQTLMSYTRQETGQDKKGEPDHKR